MKIQHKFLKHIAFLLIIIFFTISYFSPSFFFISFFGIALIAMGVFVWDIKGGIISLLIILSAGFIFFPRIKTINPEELLFTVLAYLIVFLLTKHLRKVITELRENEQKYRNFIERANDGIIINQEGKIKYANPTIESIMGFSSKEIIGSNFKNYLIGKSALSIIDHYKKKTKEENVPIIYETQLKHKSGGRIFAELNIGSIEYEGKGADLIIIRDIAQRKQVEGILYQREQEFKILIETSPDIIARFDNEGRFVYINPAVEDELGISSKEFFWKGIEEVGFAEDVAHSWKESINFVFLNNKEKVIYTDQLTPHGRKYYNTRLIPELDKDGNVRTVLSISRDITPVKEIDKVKSEFISVSSHQLRTPLSVIRWCTIMLLEGGAGKINKEQHEYLEKIYESSRKIIKMVNSFFNVATLDLGILTVSPSKINFIDLIEKIIDEAEAEIGKKAIIIEKRYPSDILWIKTDRKLLTAVLRGLLSNAIKYNDKKGKIWIEVRKKDDYVEFKIADNGYGIPKDEQYKVFSKFFRSKNIKDKEIYGSGLDLYIIKSIISSCDGNIWFQSPNPELIEEPNKGSVFYFTIPLKEIKEIEGKNELII